MSRVDVVDSRIADFQVVLAGLPPDAAVRSLDPGQDGAGQGWR